jgi:SAM-dependent methyltransferase
VQREALYRQLAEYYDRFYWWKDYGLEVEFLSQVFGLYGTDVRQVLEIACGTGSHTRILAARGYRVTGVDINGDMLRVARKKVGKRARFVQGDMRSLGDIVSDESYDAVVCLFSSISYNRTASDLRKTISGMVACARPGGLVVFDTHFTKKGFMDGYRGEDIFDDGKVMGARLGVSKRRGNIGEITFSYLIHDSPETILLRDDVHTLGLFSQRDLQREMRNAGLQRLKIFNEWNTDKKASSDQFKDIIFVGRKPIS